MNKKIIYDLCKKDLVLKHEKSDFSLNLLNYVSPEFFSLNNFILEMCFYVAQYLETFGSSEQHIDKYSNIKPFDILDRCPGDLLKNREFLLELVNKCKLMSNKYLEDLFRDKDIVYDLYEKEVKSLYKIVMSYVDEDGVPITFIGCNLKIIDFIPEELLNDKKFIFSLCSLDKKIMKKNNSRMVFKILKGGIGKLMDDKDFVLELYDDCFISAGTFPLLSERLRGDEDVVTKVLKKQCRKK